MRSSLKILGATAIALITLCPESMSKASTGDNPPSPAVKHSSATDGNTGQAWQSGRTMKTGLVTGSRSRRSARTDVETGVFRCNDGGTYYVRQVGNEVWWYGQSPDGGASWTNVFHGTISGDTIQGNWADVPKGKILGAGRMTIHVDSPYLFYATAKTGGFGGSVWQTP